MLSVSSHSQTTERNIYVMMMIIRILNNRSTCFARQQQPNRMRCGCARLYLCVECPNTIRCIQFNPFFVFWQNRMSLQQKVFPFFVCELLQNENMEHRTGQGPAAVTCSFTLKLFHSNEIYPKDVVSRDETKLCRCSIECDNCIYQIVPEIESSY